MILFLKWFENSLKTHQIKNPNLFKVRVLFCQMAEKEGFEPPVPFGTTVFKTAAFDRSAISPVQKYNFFVYFNFICKKCLCYENIL